MKRLAGAILGLSLLTAGAAQASLFHFEGEIFFHNDVAYTTFTLDEPSTDVRIWTDSFRFGVHFDPITALWKADGTLLGENDDDSSVGWGQSFWDSGMRMSGLEAGTYIFTIAAYNNFAAGDNLADGFRYDGDAGIDIDDWWVGGDGEWSLWMDGVDAAQEGHGDLPGDPVPEPATIALFALGLPAIRYAAKRRK